MDMALPREIHAGKAISISNDIAEATTMILVREIELGFECQAGMILKQRKCSRRGRCQSGRPVVVRCVLQGNRATVFDHGREGARPDFLISVFNISDLAERYCVTAECESIHHYAPCARSARAFARFASSPPSSPAIRSSIEERRRSDMKTRSSMAATLSARLRSELFFLTEIPFI